MVSNEEVMAIVSMMAGELRKTVKTATNKFLLMVAFSFIPRPFKRRPWARSTSAWAAQGSLCSRTSKSTSLLRDALFLAINDSHFAQVVTN